MPRSRKTTAGEGSAAANCAAHRRAALPGELWRLLLCAALLAGLLAGAAGPPHPAAAALLGFDTPVVLTTGAALGAAAWGDYDSDNDLDLLVTGFGNYLQSTTILFNNSGGVLAEVNAGPLPRLTHSSAAWGDYDNDNDLDLVLTGQVSSNGGQPIGLARIYANNAGVLSHLASAVLPEIYRGWADWGDYDNDGDLDLLLSGLVTGGGRTTKIFRNANGSFADSGIALPGAGYAHVAWGDFNADNYLDFVVSGMTDTGPQTLVYQHRGSATAPIFRLRDDLSLPGLWEGAASWADVDLDGYLDLLLTGNAAPSTDPTLPRQPVTRLYRYNKDTTRFDLINAGLPDLRNTSTSWGDYDNDGDPDLLINGATASTLVTAVYRNDGGTAFTKAFDLPAGYGLSVAWGNFDNDAGRALDIAVTGIEIPGSEFYATDLYRSSGQPANTVPPAPALVSACWDPARDRVFLDWSDPADDRTPGLGLTYNLRIGTAPGATNIASPMSNLASGFYRLASPGMLGGRSITLVRGLANGSYTWSVQAVDSALQGGPFSAEGTMDIGVLLGMDDLNIDVTQNQSKTINVLANDNTSRGALTILEPVGDPAWGRVSVVNGQVVYTPNTNYTGPDSFYYEVRDPSGYCTRATVTLNVSLDLSPTNITVSPTSILENMPIGQTAFTMTTSDPDNHDQSTYTYALVSGTGSTDNALFAVQGRTLVVNGPIDYENKTALLVRLRVTDPTGRTYEKALALGVTNVSDVAPVITVGGVSTPGISRTISEDGINSLGQPDGFAVAVAAQDGEPGETITWSVSSAPANGTVSFEGGATSAPGAAKTINYTPNPNWFGVDSFTVRAADTGGNTDTLAVTVTVSPVNDLPVLDPISSIAVVVDAGPQIVALSGISTGPANEGQTASLSASTDRPDLVPGLQAVYPGSGTTGEVRFTAGSAFGSATVTVTVSDGTGTSQQSFTVSVHPGGFLVFLPIINR